MSYGVVASKVGNVRVEGLRASAEEAHATSSPWAQGRIALTALHLTFVPTHRASGVGPLTLVLSDIIAVETSSSHLHRVVSFRTAEVVVHTRVPGATAFARRVALSVDAAHKRQNSSSSRSDAAQPLEVRDREITP